MKAVLVSCLVNILQTACRHRLSQEGQQLSYLLVCSRYTLAVLGCSKHLGPSNEKDVLQTWVAEGAAP